MNGISILDNFLSEEFSLYKQGLVNVATSHMTDINRLHTNMENVSKWLKEDVHRTV